MRPISMFAATLAVLLTCDLSAQAGIVTKPWGQFQGHKVNLYTLTNKGGAQVRITNYGGVIVSIKMPGRDGTFADVVQGFDSLADYTSVDYLKRGGRYGGILGRFADRIKDETYVLNGVTHHRTRDGKPYNERVWTGTAKDTADPQLVLNLTDPDGSMGFSGTLNVTVTYTLTKDNILRLDYRATTDKDTIASLTNHTYFNMAGGGTVLDQLLTVNADAITPGDAQNTPTGEVRPVAGTPFDFRKPTPIGLHINAPDTMLQRQKGYGLNYKLNGTPGTLRLAARLEDPKSGRVMVVWTTQPDIRLYSANYMPPKVALAKGFGLHTAMALETEHAANSPNIPSFVSPKITPDKPLHEITEFRFLVDKSHP